MKRALWMTLLALVCGLALGTLIGSGTLLSWISSPPSGDASPVSSVRQSSASLPPEETLDVTDNTPLLDRAGQALEDLKAQDYAALASLVHPRLGLTLTPYSTVDPALDNTLTRDQVALLGQDRQEYTWGLADGSGAPIRCTPAQYFSRYVFNADYTEAPQVGIDTVLISGNALENVAEAYPEGRFVEYHFPGIDPAMEGFDWCSIKLVFQVWQNNWYLVGIVHSEWTI